MKKLVLASQSPRRRELLALMGHPFEVAPADIEETVLPGESPDDHVTRLALAKARAIADTAANAIVIGSDTVVVIGGDILGKPRDRAEALAMLMRLSGRTHEVYTGFALAESGTDRHTEGFERTRVTMLEFDRALAERYLDTGEPFDKAGSYGIQGYGAALIRKVDGCYFTVMGLPLARLMAALAMFSEGQFDYFGTSKGGTR